MGRKKKFNEPSKILTIRVPESKLEVIKNYINFVLEKMEELGRIEDIKDLAICTYCGNIDPNYTNRTICLDCLMLLDKIESNNWMLSRLNKGKTIIDIANELGIDLKSKLFKWLKERTETVFT